MLIHMDLKNFDAVIADWTNDVAITAQNAHFPHKQRVITIPANKRRQAST